MKKSILLLFLLGLFNINYAINKDSTYQDTISTVIYKGDESQSQMPLNRAEKEQALKEQAEKIPVVFGQWWFWVGLMLMILFLKFVIFKK